MNALRRTRHRMRARSADPRRRLATLGPVAQLRAGRLPLRLVQLLLGLVLYAVSMAFLLRGTLGNMPWDVLHQGLALHIPLSLGQVVIVTSLVVLLLWIPLRQPPGLGTVANAVLVGVVVDPVLAVLPAPDEMLTRIGFASLGVLLNGVATAMYIGAQLGPGPRDGLMTGVVRWTGGSLRLIRTGIEVTVVLVGWALGGILGVFTVFYAVAIGPLTQFFLPWFVVPLDASSRPATTPHTLDP